MRGHTHQPVRTLLYVTRTVARWRRRIYKYTDNKGVCSNLVALGLYFCIFATSIGEVQLIKEKINKTELKIILMTIEKSEKV